MNKGGPARDIRANGPAPAGPVKKLDRRTRKGLMLRLGGYILQYWPLFLLAVLLTLASNQLSLMGPKYSGDAIDAIAAESGVNFDAVWENVGRMLVCYAASAILSYLLAILMIRLSQRIVYTMRKQLFEKLTSLPVSYFDTHTTGDIISRISYDIDTVNASLSQDLVQVMTSIYTVIGSLVFMWQISRPLIAVFAITVPASIFFTRFRSKRVRPLFHMRSQKLGELNGYAEEMLSGGSTIRAYGREDEISKRFAERNREAMDAYYNAEYYGAALGPSVNFINNLSISLVMIFGGMLYMFSQSGAASPGSLFFITLGGVAQFVQYSRKFAGPINEFANILNEFQSAFAAAERIFRIIDEQPEAADAPGALELSNVQGRVEVENAGKTTIINLLMRFYDVNSGRILVDGNEIRDIRRDSLRRAYTMVLQDTWLFCGTIFDNIVYGRENATMEEVRAAAKSARIDSYIERLPDGYNTMLSDDGVNISKGQRQLITIARAMLSDTSMLILDEATSNVDSRTEIKIQQAMNELMRGRTCFVIAHRLSTVQDADLILVLKDGRVIESGTHDELVKLGGFYGSLYNSQFE